MSTIGLAPYVATKQRTDRRASIGAPTSTDLTTWRPQGPRRKGSRKRPDARTALAATGRAVTSGLLVLALAAFLGLAVGPHVFGYRTATMLTGSMSPNIDAGDVVVAFPVPASTVREGDVISYHIPVEDHRVETHRIVDVTRTGDSIAVRTKGDANNGVDPWTAKLEGNTVWKVRTVVPHVGTVVRAMRAPVIQGGVFWGAIIALVAGMLVRIWRTPSEPKSTETRSPAAPARTRNHVR